MRDLAAAPIAHLLRLPALLMALTLAACGGSDSGDASAVANTPPLQSPSPDPLAPPAPVPGDPAPVPPVAVTVEEVNGQLDAPWSLAFLPDGSMLVTERRGSLRRIDAAGQLSPPLAGVPPVQAAGQGGLLDVVLSPGFDSDRTIFFTFAEPDAGGNSRAAVARAVLGDDAISGVQVIYRQTPSLPTSMHYGSRLVFDREGYLFVTFGDRGFPEGAQDLASTQGKVVRILPDGSIPPDNPVLGPGAVPGIWSYGHRNPQGAALNPLTGEVWLSEHGPRGGDEINRILPGRDYGWPRITYGRDYETGVPFGEGTTAPDVEPPLHYWVPVSIAPAGMAFYTGDKLPGWQGSLLVGALAGQMLVQLGLQGDAVVDETRHLAELGERIRAVRQGPDGHPYLLTDSGRLLRVVAR
jgi:aldose sugar dehydrogenase